VNVYGEPGGGCERLALGEKGEKNGSGVRRHRTSTAESREFRGEVSANLGKHRGRPCLREKESPDNDEIGLVLGGEEGDRGRHR